MKASERPNSFLELCVQVKFYLHNPKGVSQHLKPLTVLWSASILLSGMNLLATLLIVAEASPELYAMYTIGLSILMLASNWTDAGLASTLTVLATQSGQERERLERYKQVGFRYAIKIIPIGFVMVLGLTGLVFFQSQVFHAQDNFFVLAAFALIGVVTARTSFWNALLYASGNFKKSSVVQAAPAVARVILIGIAITITGLSFNLLVVLTLLPVAIGWGLSRHAWRRTVMAMPCALIKQSEAETNAEVWGFLKPTMMSVAFNTLSYNMTLLGASFFTTGVSIAAYGVFWRFNQAIVVLVAPLNAYVGRQLRIVASVSERKRKGTAYLAAGVLGYMVYGLVAFTAYLLLGQYLNHYSLDYPLEFFVFLLSILLGYIFVMLDTVLSSTGSASHRILGALLYCGLNTLLILVLRPDNLLIMVIIDTVSLLPAVGYYLYRFVKK